MAADGFSWSVFWQELRRRKVVRAVIAYAGVGFVLLQAADLVLPSLGLAHWYVRVLIALVAGFPAALMLAWVFEWKGGRLSRTPDAAASASVRASLATRVAMPLVLAIGIAGSAVLAGAAVLRPALVPGSPTRLAVLPLNAVDGTPAYYSIGIADLLAPNLDGGGRLETVPADLVQALVRQHKKAGEDWPRRVATESGAGAYLTGSVHVASGRMRVDVVWHELAGDDSARVWRESAEDDTTEVFRLVDGIAAKLLSRRFARGASAASIRIAAHTTTSLEALKEYLQAEEALREGRFPVAFEGFERAIEADTGFALAYYRAAFTAATAFGPGASQAPARRMSELAQQRRDRLPEHDRAIVDALVAWRTGRADEAERIYRHVLTEHPDDPEALFGLANTLLWYNPLRGRSIFESRVFYERVLAQDPEFLCPI